MRNICISDITMKEQALKAQSGLSFREKLQLAKNLDKLNVDVIEIGCPVNKKTDILLIKSLVTAVRKSTLAVSVDINDPAGIKDIAAALKGARSARLQVEVPVSTVQMEYICARKPDKVLELISQLVSRCREEMEDVEFIAQDAGRSEKEFLFKAIETAVSAGASQITVCDTAGSVLPEEAGQKTAEIKAAIPEGTRLGVSFSDEFSMAVADSMASVKAGADEVKAQAGGSGNCRLDKLVKTINAIGSLADAGCSVITSQLQRVTGQINKICEEHKEENNPAGAEKEADPSLFLSIHDSRETVQKMTAKLGYELGEEDIDKVYEAFLRIAEKKEQVGARELDAIIAAAAMQVPATYKVESYVINSGNVLTASAHMKINKGGETKETICLGDGPIDAAFRAIEQIVGRHFELDDFQVQSVTEGREAMGETVVRLRSEGKLYSGRGISTDIIGSSIRAYVNTVNKIVYEESEAAI